MNHSTVEIIAGDVLTIALVRKCWSWKDVDIVYMEEDARDLYVPRYITSQESLEDYVNI